MDDVVAFLCVLFPSWMSDERRLLIKSVQSKQSSLAVVVAIALYLQLKVAIQLCGFFLLLCEKMLCAEMNGEAASQV